jgi:hypothetical protein
MQQEEILFYGGMNSDDDPRFLPQGDYVEAQYMRGQAFTSGTGQVLTTIAGNRLVNNAGLAAGTNTVIGACPIYQTGTFANGIIFFVHNSTALHSIWYFNILTEAYTLVIQNSILNFQLTRKIINAFVLDGKLYWTDGYFTNYAQVGSNANIFNYNPPRMLNLARAIAGYSSVTMQTFDVIKWPPRFAPTAVYTDNPSSSFNLYGSLFQFRYKYIYENNEESCWSPISDLPLPENGYWMSGENTRDIQDNEIDVTYNTGSEMVLKIIHSFRLGNSGEFTDWLTIDKAEQGLANNVNDTVSFFNNSFGLSSPFNAPNFHTVPQVAGCQELLTGRGGELSYGDIRESFDPVNLNVQTSFDLKPVLYQRNAAVTNAFFANANPSVGVFTGQINLIQSNFVWSYQVGDIFVFQFEVTNVLPLPLGVHTFYYDVQDTDTDVDALLLNLEDFFDNLGFVTTVINGTTKTLTITGLQFVSAVANNGQLVVLKNVRPIRTWKTGTTHKIGIKYEDRANRESAVQYIDAGELVIPSYSQNDTSAFSNVRLPYTILAQMTIAHTPPEFATHYRICTQYSTTISSFGWYSVFSTTTVPNNPIRLRIILDIFYLVRFGVSNVHQITTGDKVRFIRKGADFDPAFDNQSPYIDTDTDFVFTVMEYVAGGQNGYDYIDVEFFDTTQYAPEILAYIQSYIVGSNIEIYTEKKVGNIEVWHETPVAFPILNAAQTGRVHGGASISGEVVEMILADQDGIFSGDLSMAVGYPIGITGNLNTGIYTIATAVYDDVTDTTTLTFTTSFPDDAFVGAYTVLFQQTSTLPALVLLGGDQGCGDIYLRQRTHETGLTGAGIVVSNVQSKRFYAPWLEDPAYSDYFPSSVNGEGRIGIENPFEKGKRLRATVVHGKTYIFESNVNNICVFEFQDREQLNDTYGPVRRLSMKGDTLQCIQERKNTSIYIQRALALDPNGAVQYTSSDKTFGGKRERQEEFGTSNPESVIPTDQGIFYYDFYNGKFVVSTNNGQQSISDGNFKFNAASAAITSAFATTSASAYCVGFHDMQNNEVGWIFNRPVDDRGAAYLKGVVFNYEQKRWKFYTSHNPTWVMNNGEFLCEWSGAQLYVDNQTLVGSTPNFATFFGVIRKVSVSFISKFTPQIIKKWHSIIIKSQGNSIRWELPEIKIPANLSYGEMESRILSNSFSIKEGYQAANYKRDLNSPNYASQDLALINGTELRGVYASHLMTLTGENKQTTLFGCNVKGTDSEAKQ